MPQKPKRPPAGELPEAVEYIAGPRLGSLGVAMWELVEGEGGGSLLPRPS